MMYGASQFLGRTIKPHSSGIQMADNGPSVALGLETALQEMQKVAIHKIAACTGEYWD